MCLTLFPAAYFVCDSQRPPPHGKCTLECLTPILFLNRDEGSSKFSRKLDESVEHSTIQKKKEAVLAPYFFSRQKLTEAPRTTLMDKSKRQSRDPLNKLCFYLLCILVFFWFCNIGIPIIIDFPEI